MNHARVWIKLKGERVTVSEAARRIGVSGTCLWYRLKRGVSREELMKPGYGPRAIAAIVERNGSPVMAALNGELSADEYLVAEEMKGKLS